MTEKEIIKRIIENTLGFHVYYKVVVTEKDIDRLVEALTKNDIGYIADLKVSEETLRTCANQFKGWWNEQKQRAEVAEQERDLYKRKIELMEGTDKIKDRALYLLAKAFVELKGYQPFEVAQLAKEFTIPEFLQQAKCEIEIEEKK